MYNWHLYVMYKILTLVIIIYLLWILYCLILHIIWRMHKHAPYGSVEFHEIVEGWRLHAIWRMHNHAHPGKVWNSMNSWKSDNYTPYGACTTMHPLGKWGIPWNRGSLTITHHTPIKQDTGSQMLPLPWKYATPRKCGIPGIHGNVKHSPSTTQTTTAVWH